MATLGINIWICLGEGSAAQIIAGTRSNEIQTSIDTIEISSPTSGIWKEHITGRKEWSFTTGFLLLTSNQAKDLLNIGQSFVVQILSREGTTVGTLLQGTATLKSCKITASIGNLCQGSFQFEGNGELAEPT